MAEEKRVIEYTSLDFDDIKEKLIEYITADKTFNSANFQGSGLNIIADLLAYVTHMTAVTANMSANEMFMDSAQLRQSIVSKAKELGYCPTSLRTPRAKIKLSFKDSNQNREYVFIPIGTRFATKYNTVFSTKEDYIAYPESKNFPTDEITFSAEFEIYEADMSTLHVQVQPSGTSQILTYKMNDNINVLTPDSLVYFLHQNPNNIYEVTFGDDVLGKAVHHGDKVILTYVVSNRGIEMNGVDYFDKAESIDGFLSYDIETLEEARDGYEQESGEDIRFRSAKMWKAQNRAVVKDDYKAILMAEYPWIECVNVWGGQDNVPPEYGKVFFSIKPKHIDVLPSALKDKIKQELIKKYNVVTVTPEIVDPDYLYIGIKTTVKYRKMSTIRSQEDIANDIRLRIIDYFGDNVAKFDYSFYHSPLIAIIDATDQSIVSSELTTFLSKRIYPTLRAEERFVGSFLNKIVPGSFESSIFNDGTEGIYLPSKLKDDGEGNINIVVANVENTNVKSNLFSKIGKIDYETGEYQFFLTTYALSDRKCVILYADTDDVDITQKTNQIIYVDKSIVNSKWGIRSGSTITLVPIDILNKTR